MDQPISKFLPNLTMHMYESLSIHVSIGYKFIKTLKVLCSLVLRKATVSRLQPTMMFVPSMPLRGISFYKLYFS